MADETTSVASLRRAMAAFVTERAWEPFHSPKNLSMALAVEAAELMELFLWIDNEASRAVANDPGQRTQIADEVADVTLLVLALCNALDIDLADACRAKLEKNVRKYPVEKYRGRFRVEE
jgi:dCTP diphosphatase